MTPRHFGHAFGFERDRVAPVADADVSEDRWAIGALICFVLVLGGIGLYVSSSSDRPVVASVPVDETSGRATRPTLPTLPY
jgi:hypothetical protein